ncbi:delta-1-pyrroline-5-carboxylate dehydrogenase, mitochondrial [Halichoeres trimaculatus]|uniref:delta-1-pyrroline-5-carboxylate dehydrogenase, mitochondrial n=1 Tax=Halichoeres trimaculatus TaxID=147232 RepID=UPI003D9E6E31
MDVFSVTECGGKNFHLVHTCVKAGSVAKGTVHSAFQYGGEKCWACSRMYVPDSTWPKIKQELLVCHKNNKIGDPVEDFSTFFSAVMDNKSSARNKQWPDHTESSPNLKVMAGSNCDSSKAYFVEPTMVESAEPQDPMVNQEILGPDLCVSVNPENRYKEVLQPMDNTSLYAPTVATVATVPMVPVMAKHHVLAGHIDIDTCSPCHLIFNKQ